MLTRRRMMRQEEENVKEWRLINTAIQEDENSWLYIKKDEDGNDFEVNELLVYFENGGTMSGGWHRIWKKEQVTNNSESDAIMALYCGITANKNMMFRITPDYGVGYDTEYGGQDVQNGHAGYQFTETITPIRAITMYNQYPPAAGTKITFYGR